MDGPGGDVPGVGPLGTGPADAGPADAGPPGTGRPSPRSRYRDQLRQEIKDAARRQLVDLGGAGQLSLNAVAKELGMRGPSLYRYFASRDALITALLVDAYGDLGECVHRAVAESAARGEAPAEQIRHYGSAYRRWGLAHPELFDLLFGRPVPGYTAPPETGSLARGPMVLLADLIRAARRPGEPAAAPDGAWRTQAVPAANEDFERAVRTSAVCHGLLVLELHGHLRHMVPDPGGLYAAELDAAIRRNTEPA